MVTQVVEALEVRSGATYVDGTIGGGGHAEAILEANAPEGRLFACDRDGAAVQAASERLARFVGRFEIRRGNYCDLGDWIAVESCHGVLLDLGVSSPQLDTPERGFSFQKDGPLDMRMDDRQSVTAAQLVNDASSRELAQLFWELGGDRNANRIARAIEQARLSGPLRTTRQLAELVERVVPRRGARIHPATRVFQALRMTVNNEVSTLREGLNTAWSLVAPGGRLLVITFHSLEDQIVKKFGREQSRDYTVTGDVDVPELRQPTVPQGRWVKRKALRPSPEEIEKNPRSRSAQLRVLEKI